MGGRLSDNKVKALVSSPTIITFLSTLETPKLELVVKLISSIV